MTRRPLLHWLLLGGLVAMWGSSFLFTKLALASLSPRVLVASRLLLATLVLGVLMAATKRRLPRSRGHWVSFALIAVVGNVIPFLLISWGQRGIDSGLAGILMAVMPLVTVLLAHFFAHEPLTPRRGLGFLLGFVGIVVLTGPAALLELRGEGTPLISRLAVLAGAVCYAINTILSRRRPASDSLAVSTGVLLIAAAIMLPVAAPTATGQLTAISPAAAVSVAFLGLVSTALATIVYFKLIAIAGPGFMSLTNYLIPLWAVAVGYLFLGEVPERSALAALILILGGIALGGRATAPDRSSPGPCPTPVSIASKQKPGPGR